MKNNLVRFFTYLSLLALGLITSSWLIWSRFIRERSIREIPDSLLTEYRFWILIYICWLYAYILKSLLITEKAEASEIKKLLYALGGYFYKPMITLDQFIKYNRYTKKKYSEGMFIILTKLVLVLPGKIKIIIISLQILPRMVLALFLALDTFYFHKLELFYKIILIGLLPFLYRYLKYSVKDVIDHWIDEVENEYGYTEVTVYEEGYEGVTEYKEGYDYSEDERRILDRVGKTDAGFHNTTVTVSEYLEILFVNYIDRIEGNYIDRIENVVSHRYVGKPSGNKDRAVERNYKQRKQDLYRHFICSYCTMELDRERYRYRLEHYARKINRDRFHEKVEMIIHYKMLFYLTQAWVDENKISKYPRILIWSTYLICWGYILSVSYYTYPIELKMFKTYILALLIHWIQDGNPF